MKTKIKPSKIESINLKLKLPYVYVIDHEDPQEEKQLKKCFVRFLQFFGFGSKCKVCHVEFTEEVKLANSNYGYAYPKERGYVIMPLTSNGLNFPCKILK